MGFAFLPALEVHHQACRTSRLSLQQSSILLDKGVDLHSYQPSVQDLARIAACDAFVYVGGESDEWVHDALKNTINSKQAAVNLLELLGEAVRPEEIVEGEECR